MKEIVFFLEEKSAGEMLKVIMPKISSDVMPRYICFEGKRDLDKNLRRKIKNYNNPHAVFLVMRDKDSAECRTLKQKLVDRIPANKKSKTLVRIACHELESFYLGDLSAVKKGMEVRLTRKKEYRNPDAVANAKQELIKITKCNYQPIAGSRAIAPYLDLQGGNQSDSFNQLIKGIKKQLGCP